MTVTQPNYMTHTRRALYLSCALILLYWIVITARQFLLRPVPGSIQELVTRKSIEAVVALLVVWFLMRLNKERITDLGFRIGFSSVLVFGVLVPIGLFLLFNIGVNTLLAAFLGGGTGSVLRTLFRDPREAPLWILTAVLGGGFAEELERAFFLTRFELLFGKVGLVAAVVASSIFFGFGHLYQGTGGAISAGLLGLVFALIFLRRRRVMDAMLAHAVFDLLGVAAAYALYGQTT